MKAITTKFFGPTETRGARVIARDSDNNSIVHSYGYERAESEHATAALKLMQKMKWTGTMYGGHVQKGMVWVFACEDYRIERTRHE